MKKVALLFTILCVGALNGMESLPSDIHGVIITQALRTSKTLDEAITVLKNLSVVHGVQFDKLFSSQKDFTKVVHMLADKFDETTDDVASKFKTEASREYLRLAKELRKAIINNNIDQAIQTIKQGADVNCDSGFTQLYYAVKANNFKMVKLLLDSGANPNFHTTDLKLALNDNLRNLTEEGKFHNQQAKAIKKLLFDLLKKHAKATAK